jgi:hypothetical protein
MGAIGKREYKGELEYYGLLSPDDGPELDEEYCDGCGDLTDELFETFEGVKLCKLCYTELTEESEEECEN